LDKLVGMSKLRNSPYRGHRFPAEVMRFSQKWTLVLPSEGMEKQRNLGHSGLD
jgi:hypothetical protein